MRRERGPHVPLENFVCERETRRKRPVIVEVAEVNVPVRRTVAVGCKLVIEAVHEAAVIIFRKSVVPVIQVVFRHFGLKRRLAQRYRLAVA